MVGMNSLYDLEFNNSQARWVKDNKVNKFKGNQDKSHLLGLSRLNQTRSPLGLTILNETKNTHIRQIQGEMDKSKEEAYQDPPSHSKIIDLDDLKTTIKHSESGVDSSVQKDEEISAI